MLSLSFAPLSYNAAPIRAPAPQMTFIEGQKPWVGSTEISDKAGMVELAKKLNPTIGFWDPLNIVNEETAPETIGWFRHAEIKHGRVAMAGFVGYVLQSNNVHFPWNIQGPFGATLGNMPSVSFADVAAAGGPADQWDALSTGAKLQILGVIGFLEMWSETSSVLEMDGQKHYVRGGKPGARRRACPPPRAMPRARARASPPRDAHRWVGRRRLLPVAQGQVPAPGAAEPVGPLRLHRQDDARAQGEGAPRRDQQRPPRDDRPLRHDLRLEGPGARATPTIPSPRPAPQPTADAASHSAGACAQIVPGLDGLGIAPYSGEIMAPFSASDNLPYVQDMLNSVGNLGY